MTEYMVRNIDNEVEQFTPYLDEAKRIAKELPMDGGVVCSIYQVHRYTTDLLVAAYQDSIDVNKLNEIAFEAEISTLCLDPYDYLEEVFEVKDHDAAQKDWEAMLEEWVRKHIRTPGPMPIGMRS
jgi:hypothetical protein